MIAEKLELIFSLASWVPKKKLEFSIDIFSTSWSFTDKFMKLLSMIKLSVPSPPSIKKSMLKTDLFITLELKYIVSLPSKVLMYLSSCLIAVPIFAVVYIVM